MGLYWDKCETEDAYSVNGFVICFVLVMQTGVVFPSSTVNKSMNL